MKDVWAIALAAPPKGKVMDPHTPPLELEWDGKESRIGKWDMGHRPGHSYNHCCPVNLSH